jgi:asparagine synthase (glutamine-hydrolysing)
MSGIAGIYYLDDKPIERETLGKMVEILAHRGPDGADVWCEGSVGLGHRMLWTTPESLLEKLPLANQTGDLVITADARIDNRDELIPQLELDIFPKEKVTDSQIILAAYEKWGEQCPEKLLGDFAFAIWDRREHKLFCARDHFGVKPFYYYSSDKIFVFATEIKAILCLPEVPCQLNEVRVGDYLTSMFEDKAITFYQDIFRLPPSHSMIVNCKAIQLQSYWSLNPNRELCLSSDEEYAAKFREIFTEAVRCRLRSAFPVGAMLSGGLDSSSIACTARTILAENEGQPLPTFSAIFDEVTECDERPYIKAVLAQGSMEPHYLHGDRLSPLTDIDTVLWHQDEPLYAFNLFLNWGLYGIANSKGVRIMLDGFDGDSTVSHGVGYLNELASSGRWLSLIAEVRGYAKNFNQSFWQWLWAYIHNYGLKPIIFKSKPLRLGLRIWQALLRRVTQRNCSSHQSSWSNTLNPDFVEHLSLETRRKVLEQALSKSRQSQKAEHYYSLMRGIMPYTLEVIDKAAAAFAIEPRFPFWDKRLVEFCLSLPPKQKIHRGWTRMVLRRGMAGILPKEVQWRGDKSNLGPSFDHGLLNFEQNRLEEVLFNNPELIGKYTEINALHEAYRRFISRKDRDDDVIAIWRALTLALWLKSFQSGKSHNLDEGGDISLIGSIARSKAY